MCFYKGLGVATNLVEARRFFNKGTDRDIMKAKFQWGLMKVRGEVGSKEIGAGINLINVAASKGCASAETFLAKNDETSAAFFDL